MNEPAKVNPGRVDHLAKGIFERLLAAHANPEVRFACRLLDGEIAACFEEHLGPGTVADKIGRRVIKAMNRENR
jgi:hypothetical protein